MGLRWYERTHYQIFLDEIAVCDVYPGEKSEHIVITHDKIPHAANSVTTVTSIIMALLTEYTYKVLRIVHMQSNETIIRKKSLIRQNGWRIVDSSLSLYIYWTEAIDKLFSHATSQNDAIQARKWLNRQDYTTIDITRMGSSS